MLAIGKPSAAVPRRLGDQKAITPNQPPRASIISLEGTRHFEYSSAL